MTLTRAHHWVPGRAAVGTRIRKLRVVRPPGRIRKPCVHGPSASQLPNGDTSCASPRISDARPLDSSTVRSAVPPGASRGAGVSVASPSSAFVAAVFASTSGSTSPSGR